MASGVDTLEAAGIPPTCLLVYMLIGFDRRETWERVLYRFRKMTARGIRPFPMVSLEILKAADIRLIAHTESKLYGVVDRLNRLNLFPYFTKVYCRERSLSSHPMPRSGVEWLDQFPMDKIIELSHHQTKPNPTVLLEICSNEGIGPELAAYVGDSVARDVLMAKRADVFAIWAAYGAQHPRVMYGDLVRVSHWTAEEIALEESLKAQAKNIKPDYIARNSFAEVVAALGIKSTAKETQHSPA